MEEATAGNQPVSIFVQAPPIRGKNAIARRQGAKGISRTKAKHPFAMEWLKNAFVLQPSVPTHSVRPVRPDTNAAQKCSTNVSGRRYAVYAGVSALLARARQATFCAALMARLGALVGGVTSASMVGHEGEVAFELF
jgi:hypothetical protein